MKVWVLERAETGEPLAAGVGAPGEDFRATAGSRLVDYVSTRPISALAVLLRHAASELRAAAYSGASPSAAGLVAGRADGMDIAAALLEGLL